MTNFYFITDNQKHSFEHLQNRVAAGQQDNRNQLSNIGQQLEFLKVKNQVINQYIELLSEKMDDAEQAIAALKLQAQIMK